MAYRAVIFDLGGVVLDSPLHAIARYERELGIPAGFVNRVVIEAGPDGAWHRLERGPRIDPPGRDRFRDGSGLRGQAGTRQEHGQAEAPTQPHSTTATILSGPPLPPRIFMGRAMTVKPVAGNSSRWATFSNAGMFRSHSTT